MLKNFLAASLTLLSFTLFAQDKASLTKEETVNYINKKLKETYGVDFSTSFEIITQSKPRASHQTRKMYVIYNECTLESDGRITHIDKIASSTAGCYSEPYYYGSKSTRVSFNPAHITRVEALSGSDPKIGSIRIDFISNTEKWEKHKYEYKLRSEVKKKVYSHRDFFGNPVYYDNVSDVYRCDDSWSSTDVPTGSLIVYYFSSDPENGNRLVKAFKHLVALAKAEDDPFGNE